MKTLIVGAECVPFIKTGGLADVVGALPKKLKELDVDVRVVLPNYEMIPDTFKVNMKTELSFTVHVGYKKSHCNVKSLDYENITYYFIDNEYYFGTRKSDLYGYDDDAERFVFFSYAVLQLIKELDFKPDILHLNDWHTGVIPYLLKRDTSKKMSNIKTLFTIHNIQHQGIFPLHTFELFNTNYSEVLEFDNCINFMKSGIVSSDLINTVSPTYKEEIMTKYYGHGLNNLLKEREHILKGVLNGIDYKVYNPQTDELIHKNYNSRAFISGKRANKRYLQEMMNIPIKKDTPVISLVSRLAEQKGLDLIIHVIEELLKRNNLQFIILGTGQKKYEEYFRLLENKYPNKVKACIEYSNTLAQQIYAGSDIFLMPSRFEPCGLSQLISLRYGTVPIVRETGGLKDSIEPFNEYTGEGYGFSFKNYNAHEMMKIIRYTLEFYHNNEEWRKIIKKGMRKDFSWQFSAKNYLDIYKSLLDNELLIK